MKIDKEIREGLYDPRREQNYIIYLKGKKYGTIKAKSLGEAKRKAWMALGISYKVEATPAKKEKHFKKTYDPETMRHEKRGKGHIKGKSSVPPQRWYEAMVKGIRKSSGGNPYAIVKSIWSKLSPSGKAKIRAREAKGEHFKYNFPLPVDKPTKGIGTVRIVKPFNLAEVQVNLSVKDYLTALSSGIFSKMKRGDGTTVLVARCKSDRPKERNVNIFVDKATGR